MKIIKNEDEMSYTTKNKNNNNKSEFSEEIEYTPTIYLPNNLHTYVDSHKHLYRADFD